MTVGTPVRSHYDGYYGDQRLAEWRRLGAMDKAANIVELCAGLDIRSVLEVGCGDGAILARLITLGFGGSHTGMDISTSAIAAARARGAPARFDTFDGSRLPFREASIDLIVMSHVIEHLEHPRALLYEAKRVARNVLIEVPCEHTIRTPRDYMPDPVGHINLYTPQTIRHLLQTCGFTVDRQITRGCSLEMMRFHGRLRGLVLHAIRETALAITPRLAPAVFVYHTALLCH